MLHAVTLSYTQPVQTLAPYVEAHKKWLAEGVSKGWVIVAGPLTGGNAGFILFQADDAEWITTFLQSDPFVVHELVTVEMHSISPAIGSKNFHVDWAASATLL